MAEFYAAAAISIGIAAAILVGLMIYVYVKGDDFDDFAH
jgi:hypothetical protein